MLKVFIFPLFNYFVAEKKLVFKKSAGWLLFWLLVAPPVGYIWLIFGMEKKEIRK